MCGVSKKKIYIYIYKETKNGNTASANDTPASIYCNIIFALFITTQLSRVRYAYCSRLHKKTKRDNNDDDDA